MLVKHVEDPKRSPFAKDCPQRPFECLIDTLIKVCVFCSPTVCEGKDFTDDIQYPWYMVDHITIEDRDLLFTAASRLIEMLFQRVANDAENTTIDIRLLNRVKRACFQCDGFTEAQKDDCAFICGLTGGAAGLSPYADHWYIFRVIGPKAGVVPDVLEVSTQFPIVHHPSDLHRLTKCTVLPSSNPRSHNLRRSRYSTRRPRPSTASSRPPTIHFRPNQYPLRTRCDEDVHCRSR